MDVEASRAIRQAEVGAARTMIERGMDRFDLYPEHRAGDSAYGASEMVGCDYEGLAAPVMNSSLPPPPRTSENSPSSDRNSNQLQLWRKQLWRNKKGDMSNHDD